MSTYFITDERMLKHKCEWDIAHIETPARLKWILDKLRRTDLLDKCEKLESRSASMEELELVHTKDYIGRIKSTEDMTLEEQEQFCSQYEDIYINKSSWELALLSAGSALELTETVLKTPNSNGFAAIRPPGHHASNDKACGFCLFNNVVICAKKALSLGLKRVLIVDWDVHAGQGTQYSIKDEEDRIKLVSIHRYEDGTFWPQLPESSIANKYSNTLNIPLNSIQFGDNDYLSIMFSLILPLIENWKPELILVSCGFDAAIGDPEGEMEVTPLGFGTMTSFLAMQGIPLVLLLEGGYFLESIGESTECVLQALIEREPPKMFIDKIGPSPKLLDSLIHALQKYSPLLDYDFVENVNLIRKTKKLTEISKIPRNEYKGKRELSYPYPTRDQYTPRDSEVEESFRKKLHEMIIYRKEHQKNEIKWKFEAKILELTIEGKTYKLHLENISDLVFTYRFIILPLTLKYELTPSVYNFDDFSSNFHTLSSSTNELVSKKLIGGILELSEDFGFW